MSHEISILIADDYPVVRKGLREIIEEADGLQVIAEVGDGQAALEQILALQPHVAILDIKMPGLGGFDVVRQLRAANAPTAIIFLTMYNDEATFRAALTLDIAGFVSKESALTEIVASIQAVAAGESYISPSLSKYTMKRVNEATKLVQQFPQLNKLTPTERQILRLIAESLTSNEIGKALKIHPRTVDNHRTNISHKLELHGPHALVKFAIEHKNDLP
jgi:DNA-binding NarL/FixJ family response regulator